LAILCTTNKKGEAMAALRGKSYLLPGLFLAMMSVLWLGLSYMPPQEVARGKLNKIAQCEKSADEKSISTLLKLLKDKNEKVREQAAYALGARTSCWCPHHGEPTKIGTLNDERVMKALVLSLKDKSPTVRLAVVHSLTVYRSPLMVEPLIEALKDTGGKTEFNPQHPVGSYAAYTLGQLKNPRAIEPLIRAMTSEDGDIRWQARDALEQMGEKDRVAEEIRKLTPFFLEELQSESADIIERAIYVAGLFGIREAVPRLNELMENRELKIRTAAAQALSYIGNETSVPSLLKALEDSEPTVRGQAAIALGVMRKGSALPDIIHLTEDTDASVRVAALHALKFFDDSEIFPPLVKAIWDTDINVARAAIYVLGGKFNRNQGNPQSYEVLVPRVLQVMQGMSWGDGSRQSALEILVAVEDERALPEIYNEFLRRNVKDALFANEDVLPVKMAALIAKFGSADQRKEAIEWLKKVSTENPSRNNRRHAAESLKELGIAED
jgi:HEAT repeat protein